MAKNSNDDFYNPFSDYNPLEGDDFFDECRRPAGQYSENINNLFESFIKAVNGKNSGLTSQPMHDKRQVKALDDLDIGKSYIGMNSKYGSTGEFEVVSTNAKNGWIKLKYKGLNGDFFESEQRLGDLGLAPYFPNKNWNPVNYVIPREDE
jgi:hypothetical protein